MRKISRYFCGVIFFVFVASTVAFGQVHHKLKVSLRPDDYRIEVVDEITLSQTTDAKSIIFALNRNLHLTATGAKCEKISSKNEVNMYELTLFSGRQFTVSYYGEIYGEIFSSVSGEEYARGFSETSGIISPGGVYLSGSGFWYPRFENESLLTFDMEIKLPEGWSSVSQGIRFKCSDGREMWRENNPQEEIYLIANKFTEYDKLSEDIDVMVFLRKPDNQLAQKYLEATFGYIEIYNKLLGPYPYKKFALVENFWETGYGMPSFTLLGSRVIHLPFILYTSYPHEILHNWWGNGVYVDYEKGNWCEGLTAYLADHFLKEKKGEGSEYRRSILQKYKNYVSAGAGRDFPVSEFHSRHSAATEAVGYGKTAMFFHMLRRQVGDDVFFNALRKFYSDYKFKFASFDDIEKVFSEESGKDLKWMFEQWVERTGAPSLKVDDVLVKKDGDKYCFSAFIRQTQKTTYQLKVPVAVYMEGVPEPYGADVDISNASMCFYAELPARPILFSVDPEFDVFRVLDDNEIPPAISQIFGAEKALAILPANASEAIISGYRKLAKNWRIEAKLDNELEELPSDRALWIMGWENKFREDAVKSLSDYKFSDDGDGVTINGVRLDRNGNSVIIVGRHNKYALAWLATDNVKAINGLGSKLVHYGKYSYLGFVGDGPDNVLKGQWPVMNSPLSIPIIEESEMRMKRIIGRLSSKEFEGRGIDTFGIDKARDFVAKEFERIGLVSAGDNYFQIFQYKDDKSGRDFTLKNIIGVIHGRNRNESIVIGAHYDHLGFGWPDIKEEKYKGQIHPGANDNASGVAVLLEVARSLVSQNFKPERNIIFVAFSGEEAGRIGSKYYATHMIGEKCVGMINLDTVGRVENDKLFVIGARSAKEWEELLKVAASATGIELIFVKEDLDSSDQKSFHEAGIPAVQFFSGIDLNYHCPTDTADRINFDSLVGVARFTEETVKKIMDRDLIITADMKEKPEEKPKEKIKVSLGTIPDFTYQGVGYKLAGVKPESPAVEARLQAGDIIVKINNEDIKDLRGFADILRSLKIGDKILITFLRNEERRETETILK